MKCPYCSKELIVGKFDENFKPVAFSCLCGDWIGALGHIPASREALRQLNRLKYRKKRKKPPKPGFRFSHEQKVMVALAFVTFLAFLFLKSYLGE